MEYIPSIDQIREPSYHSASKTSRRVEMHALHDNLLATVSDREAQRE